MNAKYIVVNHGDPRGDTLYIMPEYIEHRRMAQGVCDCENHPVSAGFITLRDGEFYCHGESISLGLKSRPDEDGVLANLMFGR